jgi:hypothetical protein
MRTGNLNHVNHWKGEETSNYNIEVEYLFYDNLGVIKGKYEQYKTLEPSQRRAFIEANTEITHIRIGVNKTYYIGIKGKMQKPENLRGSEIYKAVLLK